VPRHLQIRLGTWPTLPGGFIHASNRPKHLQIPLGTWPMLPAFFINASRPPVCSEMELNAPSLPIEVGARASVISELKIIVTQPCAFCCTGTDSTALPSFHCVLCSVNCLSVEQSCCTPHVQLQTWAEEGKGEQMQVN